MVALTPPWSWQHLAPSTNVLITAEEGSNATKSPGGLQQRLSLALKKVQLCSFCCSRTLCFSIPTINTSIVWPQFFWFNDFWGKKNTLQSFYLVMNAVCRKIYCVVILTFEKQYSTEVWYPSPLINCNRSKWMMTVCLNHVVTRANPTIENNFWQKMCFNCLILIKHLFMPWYPRRWVTEVTHCRRKNIHL